MLYPCRECGNDVSEGARRCPYCGAKRPMIRTALHPKGLHKPVAGASRPVQVLRVIGGLIGIVFVIGLFTDFFGLPRYSAEREYMQSEALRTEVEAYVIQPCLRAFLQMDSAYLQASNKPERERAFRYDPRVRDVLDDTVARSVSTVERIPTLNERKTLYEGMLAMCSAGAG